MNAVTQGAMWKARQRHLANRIVQALPQWQSGLDVSAVGLYCQSYGQAYVSTDTGTTGATAPGATSAEVSDGGVTWAFVPNMAMLQFRYEAPPTI